LEVAAENDVIDLLKAAQGRQLLTGPATLGLIYLDDPDGDRYYNLRELHQAGGYAQVGCWECAPN
jgi:hypothetical protein